MASAKYIPMKGDRVRESGRGGIVGHVDIVRHTSKGLEAKVWEDGAFGGQWIKASNLTRIGHSDRPPQGLALRILMGGARGDRGFARYPEGIFKSPRDMVTMRAKTPAQLDREIAEALARKGR